MVIDINNKLYKKVIKKKLNNLYNRISIYIGSSNYYRGGNIKN